MTLFTGCYNKPQYNKKDIDVEVRKLDLPMQSEHLLETYFPVFKDTVWYYKGDIYLQDTRLWVDFIRDKAFQMHFKDGQTEWIKIYIEEEDAIYEVATIEDVIHKQDYTNVRQYKNVVLKLPIEKGATWVQSDGVAKTIANTNVKIKTPLGHFNAIEVVTKGPDFTMTEYYSEKLGCIKKVYSDGKKEECKELINYESNKAVKHNITLYLGNKETGKLEAVQQEITIRTNEEPKHFLTDLLSKSIEENYIIPLLTGTMIEAIYIDKDENRLIVDMNAAYGFIDYETGTEKLAVMSLVNTIGYYYGVGEVVLTVEGSSSQATYILQDLESQITKNK